MFHVLDDLEDFTDGRFQRLIRALFLRDDLFPVPLIDISAVQVVQQFIPPDCIHVCIKPFMDIKSVFLKRIPLPLRKRLNDFNPLLGHFLHLEGNGTLDTVEVIIQTALLCDKQRCADPGKIHLFSEFFLKGVTDVLDCFLCFTNRKYRIVSLWCDNFHNAYPLI